MKRALLAASVWLGLCCLAAVNAAADGPPLFAFENGVRVGEAPQQAALLKQLGYDGIGSARPEDLAQRLRAYDEAGIKFFSIYVGATLAAEGPSYPPAIPQAIQQLRGRDAVVELTLRGAAPDGERQAVQVVREIADLAAKAGLRVVLYPHYGFYVARVDQAVRLARLVERDNVGVMFNLCHFLRDQDVSELESTLALAAPCLMQVSICGADNDGQDWSTLIQTLDRGGFDQLRLLKLLRQQGFRGPVGLQCYNVPGDPRENLRRSIEAWRELMRRLEQEGR